MCGHSTYAIEYTQRTSTWAAHLLSPPHQQRPSSARQHSCALWQVTASWCVSACFESVSTIVTTGNVRHFSGGHWHRHARALDSVQRGLWRQANGMAVAHGHTGCGVGATLSPRRSYSAACCRLHRWHCRWCDVLFRSLLILTYSGLSTIAVCAPSEKFLMWSGPLAMGMGVVFVSTLGTWFLPPTSALGAGRFCVFARK